MWNYHRYVLILILIFCTTLVMTLMNMKFLWKIQRVDISAQRTMYGNNNRNNIINDINRDVTPEVDPTCPGEFQLDYDIFRFLDRIQHRSLYNSTDDKRIYNEKIVILTPVSNAGKMLGHYFNLLCSLNYPHELISIGLGEDTSKDETLELAVYYQRKLRRHFRRIDVHHFSVDLKGEPMYSRHDKEWQLKRRSHLALARNQLITYALRDENYVFWLDVDVKYIPPDIIQHLLSAHADVVAAPCYNTQKDGSLRNYDLNSWQETEESRKYLAQVPKDFLMLEGYDHSRRRMLADIKDGGLVVDLDGVGGCTLLVRAQCHREGLVFPTSLFQNHIETEGLAKLAKEMRYTVRGLPFVTVVHS